MWVARMWVARLARGSPASCRGAMTSTTRRSAPLAPRSVRLFSRGTIFAFRTGQGGAGRHPASDGTSNPHVGRASCGSRACGSRACGSRACGSRVSREAPRHPAGERWHQRHANRSSRAAVRSSFLSRDDLRVSHRTGRRGTPPCIGRDVQPTCGSRACGSRVSREAPRHPAGERWPQRHAHPSSRAGVRSSLSCQNDRRNSPQAGRRGTPPCIGRDVQPTCHRTGRPIPSSLDRPNKMLHLDHWAEYSSV